MNNMYNMYNMHCMRTFPKACTGRSLFPEAMETVSVVENAKVSHKERENFAARCLSTSRLERRNQIQFEIDEARIGEAKAGRISDSCCG